MDGVWTPVVTLAITLLSSWILIDTEHPLFLLFYPLLLIADILGGDVL